MTGYDKTTPVDFCNKVIIETTKSNVTIRCSSQLFSFPILIKSIPPHSIIMYISHNFKQALCASILGVSTSLRICIQLLAITNNQATNSPISLTHGPSDPPSSPKQNYNPLSPPSPWLPTDTFPPLRRPITSAPNLY